MIVGQIPFWEDREALLLSGSIIERPVFKDKMSDGRQETDMLINTSKI